MVVMKIFFYCFLFIIKEGILDVFGNRDIKVVDFYVGIFFYFYLVGFWCGVDLERFKLIGLGF